MKLEDSTLIKAWLEQKRLDLRESQDKVIAEMKKLKWYQSDKELSRIFNTYQIQEFFVDDLLSDIALSNTEQTKEKE